MGKAMAAIAKLAALQRKRSQQAAQPQTVEDVVRQLMRPMLENWLDRAVPKLVENALRPELKRAFGEYSHRDCRCATPVGQGLFS